MIKIKTVSDKDVLSIKENHVLRCFTDYLYHTHAIDRIQEELDYIATELASGAPSTGIIQVSKDAKNNLSPWQNELFEREYELVKEQDKHIDAKTEVDQWLGSIRNDKHKEIIIDYVINNRCEDAEGVAHSCFTTPSNVCNVVKRIISNIARKIV